MNYKVSYIMGDESSPGLIVIRQTYPQIGEKVRFDGKDCVVKEVVELTPTTDGEQFLLVMVEEM